MATLVTPVKQERARAKEEETERERERERERESRAGRVMTRGNQRDVDRARAAKRNGKKGKPGKEIDGLTKEQRKQRDAEALQAKIAAKKAAKEGAAKK